MIDYFGYIDFPHIVEFDNVLIRPIYGFNKSKEWIKTYLHKDGFVYPPISHERETKFGDNTIARIVPNTERPALLHKLPISNFINIGTTKSKQYLRERDFTFFINLLAFLCGTRLQYYNWWFDGRVPIKNMDGISVISPITWNEFFECVYSTWMCWKDEYKLRFNNLLVMHNRVNSYEWDSERFTFNYMVFDGAYFLSQKLYKLKKVGHKEQFYNIIDKFGLRMNKEHIDNIYRLRTDLFHYTVWDGGIMNSPKNKFKGWIQDSVLRKFNQRLIVALLGYETEFIKTVWWSDLKTPIDREHYRKIKSI